jgi:hypothetical protein
MPVGRPFSATNPGNPKGRPPAAIDIAALAREHGPRCIEVLAEMLEDPDRKVRGFAALALLDRGFGRPRQTIESEGPPSLSLLHLVAAREVSERLQAELLAGRRDRTPPPMIEGDPVPRAPNLYEPALE